jgi:hypothetical protein
VGDHAACWTRLSGSTDGLHTDPVRQFQIATERVGKLNLPRGTTLGLDICGELTRIDMHFALEMATFSRFKL